MDYNNNGDYNLEPSEPYELERRLDDPDDPSEVTIYDPDADNLTTTWLTADLEVAVDLEETL
ncbi:hypothetical protein [Candidatus Nanohalococcus occultus]|uniref:DUF7511 domain-containing protein n=1 Tax=Candidatus Nanohalococcus occultus TaxID=2978047 RepID=A0ABY8CEI7_9ARCH|nr:Uncharacterized protein SVXNc_0619 [Candidatus Nanohaloarchaeota archaeon SVXNc]